MFRKLFLTAALAAATLTGTAVTPSTAQAQPPVQRAGNDNYRGRDDRRQDQRGRYEVFVRHNGHWDSRGKYRDRDDAQRAASRLRQQGFRVKIDDC